MIGGAEQVLHLFTINLARVVLDRAVLSPIDWSATQVSRSSGKPSSRSEVGIATADTEVGGFL